MSDDMNKTQEHENIEDANAKEQQEKIDDVVEEKEETMQESEHKQEETQPLPKRQEDVEDMPKKKTGRKILVAVLVVALLSAVGVGVWYYLSNRAPNEENMVVLYDDGFVVEGVTYHGAELGGKTFQETKTAIAETGKEHPEKIGLPLSIGESSKTLLKAEQLGLSVDTESTTQTAYLVGRKGGISEREEQVASATEKGIAVNDAFVYESEGLKERIADAVEELAVKPQEPTLEIVHNGEYQKPTIRYVEGKAGIKVDEEVFVKRVYDAITNGDFGEIEVPGEVAEPKQSKEEFEKSMVKVSETFYTNITGNQANPNRVHNIVSMSKIITDKSYILPGQEFSVNQAAGPRNGSNNGLWKMAVGLVSGRNEQEWGGGICQATTTAYNALVMSDIDVLERSSHSIRSRYVQVGRDAMITTGGADLRWKNNTDHPMVLVMWVEKVSGYYRVFAEVWGQPLADNINHIEFLGVQTSSVSAGPVEYTTDPKLVRGGSTGATAQNYKIYHYKDGTTKKVAYHSSRYRAWSKVVYRPGGAPTEVPTQTTQAPTQKPVPTQTSPGTPSPTPTQKPTPMPTQKPSPTPKPTEGGNAG